MSRRVDETPEQYRTRLQHARQHGDPDALVPFAFRGHIPRKGMIAAGSIGHGALRNRTCVAGGIAMLDPDAQAEYIAKCRKSYSKAYPWKHLAKHAPTDAHPDGARFSRAECIAARKAYGEGVIVELDAVELAKSRGFGAPDSMEMAKDAGFTGRSEAKAAEFLRGLDVNPAELKALEFLRGLSDYELNNEPEVIAAPKPGRKRKSKKAKPAPDAPIELGEA